MNQKLAYCGFGVADVDAWVRFGVDALGLQLVEGAGVKRLRMDDRAWRLALHEAENDDILYAGFEVESAADLDALRGRLDAANIAWSDLDADECRQRLVATGLCLQDPQGLRIEFVYNHAAASDAFKSTLVGGFVTGDQGMGHAVFSVHNLDESIAFYEKLGLKLSDFITQPIGPDVKLRVAFMHCNARHHTVAMAQLPGPKRFNHLLIELQHVDDVLQGHARCTAMGYKVGNFGRHSNDEMLSFYVTSPAGLDIEYGWGGKHIEGDWSVKEYDRFSLWGHDQLGQDLT